MFVRKCYTEASDIYVTEVLTAKLAVYRCKKLPLKLLCYYFDKEVFIISVADTFIYNKSPEHQ